MELEPVAENYIYEAIKEKSRRKILSYNAFERFEEVVAELEKVAEDGNRKYIKEVVDSFTKLQKQLEGLQDRMEKSEEFNMLSDQVIGNFVNTSLKPAIKLATNNLKYATVIERFEVSKIMYARSITDYYLKRGNLR